MHQKIVTAIGSLLDELSNMGVQFVKSEYSQESFGDFNIDCTLSDKQFRLFTDRGQYMISGDIEELKQLGIWRAFDSAKEYSAAVIKYAKSVA